DRIQAAAAVRDAVRLQLTRFRPSRGRRYSTANIHICAPWTGVAVQVTLYEPAAVTVRAATAHCATEPGTRTESITWKPLLAATVPPPGGMIASPYQNATIVAGPVVVTLLLVTATGVLPWTTV